MKIIEIIYNIGSGGAETMVTDLSNKLAERGHQVILCMLSKTDDESLIFNKQFLNNNVTFHSMEFSNGFTFDKIIKLEKFVKMQNPDIVHCHLNVIPYIYRLAVFNKKIIFFHTLHNIAEHTGSQGLQYYLNKIFYKHKLIFPICISKLCQESYNRVYGLYNAPFINNGRTSQNLSDKFSLVKKEVLSYKTSTHTKVFIHVARFSEQKNQDLLISSFNQLYSQNCDFVLLIVGSQFDITEAQNLKQKACERILFLGEKNNVADYLECSDAFCLTSIYEGLPISLLEALSYGVTPICTAVGGIPDVIKDGKYGYLSSDITIESYVNAIKRFLKKPIEKNILKKYYSDNFSMNMCAQKYENEFISKFKK